MAAARELDARTGLAVHCPVAGLPLTQSKSISGHLQALMRTIRRKEGTVERHLGRVTTAAFGDLPRDALLTADEVADWLKVARRQVQRLGIPWIDLGRKTPSYQVKDVLAWLETRPRAVAS